MALWWALVVPWLRRGPRSDAMLGFLWRLEKLYVRWRHNLTVEGREHLPADDDDHDGLILVSNHTSAIDPFLLQAAGAFWIRWMMAEDMMGGELGWAWRLQRVIPVDRTGGDRTSLREAIREVKSGGCVGVFPEARLVQPPGEVRPFLAGVGMLAARTRKPVLLAWISGTPQTRQQWAGLTMKSNARVVFLGRYEFKDERDPKVIAEHLRLEIARVSGWELNDEMLPMGEPTSRPAH